MLWRRTPKPQFVAGRPPWLRRPTIRLSACSRSRTSSLLDLDGANISDMDAEHMAGNPPFTYGRMGGAGRSGQLLQDAERKIDIRSTSVADSRDDISRRHLESDRQLDSDTHETVPLQDTQSSGSNQLVQDSCMNGRDFQTVLEQAVYEEVRTPTRRSVSADEDRHARSDRRPHTKCDPLVLPPSPRNQTAEQLKDALRRAETLESKIHTTQTANAAWTDQQQYAEHCEQIQFRRFELCAGEWMTTQQQNYVSGQALWQQQFQIIVQIESTAVQRMDNAAKNDVSIAEMFLQSRLNHEESQMQLHVERQRA